MQRKTFNAKVRPLRTIDRSKKVRAVEEIEKIGPASSRQFGINSNTSNSNPLDSDFPTSKSSSTRSTKLSTLSSEIPFVFPFYLYL